MTPSSKPAQMQRIGFDLAKESGMTRQASASREDAPGQVNDDDLIEGQAAGAGTKPAAGRGRDRRAHYDSCVTVTL
jgi:hypothetical protein